MLSFGNFGSFALSESAPLSDLFLMGNPNESQEDGEKSAELLISNRDMLDDYFCLRISKDGAIETIPSLVDGYLPQLESLPTLVSTLAYDVDWDHVRNLFF